MPSIYDLKPAFQRLLRPLLDALVRLRVSPNAVTWSAIALSLVTGIAVWLAGDQPAWLWAIPPALFVRMALNALDGMLARQLKRQTAFGEVLNELGDVGSDAMIFLPCVRLVDGAPGVASVLAFAVLGIICEFSGLLAARVGGERRFDGPMGKSDRAFLVGAYALALAIWPPLRAHGAWVFLGASLLLVLSVRNRLRAGLRAAALRSAELRANVEEATPAPGEENA